MTSLSKKGPVYKQKSHGIEVAVWKREHDGKAVLQRQRNPLVPGQRRQLEDQQ
jgi:hypothetical protein